MKTEAAFDRDLRIMRRAALFMAGANLGVAFANALSQSWVYAITATLWAVVCLLWRGFAHVWQVTRDEARLAQAMIHGLEQRDRESQQ
jgi:hypothetical protein